MKQKKIGSLIAQCRKEKNLTQKELAERLNVTDKAVSKWETGKSIPDPLLMQRICDELEITLEELFNGEKIEDIINEEEEDLKRKKWIRRLVILAVSIGYFFLVRSDLNRVDDFQEPYWVIGVIDISEEEKVYICPGYFFKVSLDTGGYYIEDMKVPPFYAYEVWILGIRTGADNANMEIREAWGTVVGIERRDESFPYVVIVSDGYFFYRFTIFEETIISGEGTAENIEISVGDNVKMWSEYYPCVYPGGHEDIEYPAAFVTFIEE